MSYQSSLSPVPVLCVAGGFSHAVTMMLKIRSRGGREECWLDVLLSLQLGGRYDTMQSTECILPFIC